MKWGNMKNKKNFNNLFDSIIVTLVLILGISLYLLMMYFGVLHPREGTNPIATLIVGTVYVGGLLLIGIVIFLIYCYEYWYFDDKLIFSKKILGKRKIILFDQIEKVEKKKIQSLVFGLYSSEVYVIYSAKTKITISKSSRKNYDDLDNIMKKYIDN